MSRHSTRSRNRRDSIFTRSQLKSLREDGKYKNRHIFKFNDMFSDMVNEGYDTIYNDIKGTENHLRLEHPTISQEKLAVKTFKIFKEEFEGATQIPSPRNSNSSGTRGRRSRGSNSSGTRGRRSRGSNSSGTRGRRSRGSNSSGTRGRRGSRSSNSGIRRISSDRSLHSSDL